MRILECAVVVDIGALAIARRWWTFARLHIRITRAVDFRHYGSLSAGAAPHLILQLLWRRSVIRAAGENERAGNAEDEEKRLHLRILVRRLFNANIARAAKFFQRLRSDARDRKSAVIAPEILLQGYRLGVFPDGNGRRIDRMVLARSARNPAARSLPRATWAGAGVAKTGRSRFVSTLRSAK